MGKSYRGKLRDPDRSIRTLYARGYLIKVEGFIATTRNGLPTRAEDFSAAQRTEILARDEYKCVICGQGPREGMEIHADHIKPKDRGGKATIENGQTLCSTHNYRKKNLKQTETGKKMFIHLLELAKQEMTLSFKISAGCAPDLRNPRYQRPHKVAETARSDF